MSSANSNDIPSSPAPKGAGRRWHDIALLGVLFGFVIIGLAGLAAATGWEETKHQLSKLSLNQLAVLLALSLVNYLFRGARWHVFARRLGLPTTLRQDLRHFLGGFAMSVTPGRVGELIRMRWLRRETGWAVERTAPLVLMDRASDLAAMALILAGGIALSAGGIAMALPVAALALAAAYVATRPKLLAGLSASSGPRSNGRTILRHLFKRPDHCCDTLPWSGWLAGRGLRLSYPFNVDGRGYRLGQSRRDLHVFYPCGGPNGCPGWGWWRRGRNGRPA